MSIYISRAALDAIVSQADQMPGEECCGLLLAIPGSPVRRIDNILPAANIAPDRTRRFEIDPATLIRAHRAERRGGARIVGCYHSHPGGDPTPSAEDARQAEANGGLWLICAGPPWTASLWRTAAQGQVHGRFDPVAMTVDNGDNTGP